MNRRILKKIVFFLFTACLCLFFDKFVGSSGGCYSLRRPVYSCGKYKNYKGESTLKHSFDSAFIFWNTALFRKYPTEEQKANWIAKSNVSERRETPVITWIGHSTFLIQVGNLNILTDPIYGDLQKLLYPRILPEGIPFEDLPPIDVILISHNHRDHLDRKTLLKLKEKNPGVLVLVPEENEHWFSKKKFKVESFTWWEKFENQEVSFSCLPAVHWSVRTILRNRSLWCSWMISYKGKNIYFAGDTGYDSHFKEIAQEFDNISVALLPIGPIEPRKYQKCDHMDPKEACQAFLDLKAKYMIPMHWGTFGLGPDFFDDPIKVLETWEKDNVKLLKNNKIFKCKSGQSLAL